MSSGRPRIARGIVRHPSSTHSLGYQLLHQLWPSYLAYATSFLTIGIIGINHHHVMETIVRVDRTLLFINTLLLLVVAFIHFPTRLVAHYLGIPGERDAVYAYGVTLLLMAVLFNVLWAYASQNRRLISEEMPDAKVRAVTQAAPLTALILVIAISSPVGAIIFALAISAFYLPDAARFDRS